jgi:hypothetical protein
MYVDVKQEWQKDNCINPECQNDSKLELVCGNSRIRFCGRLGCLEYAKKLTLNPMFGDEI